MTQNFKLLSLIHKYKIILMERRAFFLGGGICILLNLHYSKFVLLDDRNSMRSHDVESCKKGPHTFPKKAQYSTDQGKTFLIRINLFISFYVY